MTRDAVKHVAVIVAGGIGVALLLRHYKSELNVETTDSVGTPDNYPSILQSVPADNTLAARSKANLDYNVPSTRLIVNTANKGCGCKCEGEGSSAHIELPTFNLPSFDYQPLPTAPSGSGSDPIAFNTIYSATAPTPKSLAQATANSILAAEKAGITDAATLKAIMREVIYDHYGF